MSKDNAEARRPLPPDKLLEALQDRVHESDGKLVRSKATHLHVRKKENIQRIALALLALLIAVAIGMPLMAGLILVPE